MKAPFIPLLVVATVSSQAAIYLPSSSQANTTAASEVSVTLNIQGDGTVILSDVTLNIASAPVFAFDGNPVSAATADLLDGTGLSGTIGIPTTGFGESFTLTATAYSEVNQTTGAGVTVNATGYAHNNNGLGVNGGSGANNVGGLEGIIFTVTGLDSAYLLKLTSYGVGTYLAGTDTSTIINSGGVSYTSGDQTVTLGGDVSVAGGSDGATFFTLTQVSGDGIRLDWLEIDIVPIPEPSGLALGALGLAGLAMAARRRK